MISALFVHTVFVCFVVFLYCVYGKFPDLYYLQIFYYSGGLLLLTLGICYTTSAVVVFFRDLSQMINIALQVGVWLTPIMWIADDMLASHKTLLTILKLNPIYYIVSGYRDAFIYKNWFWERPLWTLYFWGFTIAVFLFGNWVFKRLRSTFCRRALSRAKTPIASETLASQIAKRCFYRANALTRCSRSGIEVRLKAQRKGVQKQKGE